MKNKTLYTLLCTTILIPTICLAAEKMEPQTPSKQISQLEHQRDALPETPQIREQLETGYAGVYSNDILPLVVEAGVAAARTARDQEKDKLDSQIQSLKAKKKLDMSKAQVTERDSAAIQRSALRYDQGKKEQEQDRQRADDLARQLEETKRAFTLAEKQQAELQSKLEAAEREAEGAKKEAAGATTAVKTQSGHIIAIRKAFEEKRQEVQELQATIERITEEKELQSIPLELRTKFLEERGLKTPASGKGIASSTSVRRTVQRSPEAPKKTEAQVVPPTSEKKAPTAKKLLEDDAEF